MTTGELVSGPVDEAWNAARLSQRTTDVLVRRLHQTLDDIGDEFGLTRERVRQIERDGSRSLLRALGKASPDVLHQAVTGLVTQARLLTADEVLELLPTAQPERALVVISALSGKPQRVWGQHLRNYWAISATALEQRLTEVALQAPFRDDHVEELCAAAGVPEQLPARAYLALPRSGVDRHPCGPAWVRRSARHRDAAFLFLAERGEPVDAATIANAVGLREQAMRESMRRDERFVQLRPAGTWARVDWHASGSDGPRDAIEAVTKILSDQGPIPFAELLRQMRDLYPVTPWRVRQVLSIDRFGQFPDGRVGLVNDGATPTTEPEPDRPESVQRNADGTVLAYRLLVDRDLTRGSGLGVPRYLAWAMGLRTVPSQRIFTAIDADESVTIRRISSACQVSSLRRLASGLGAIEGCILALVFFLEAGSVRVVHGCSPDRCPTRIE